MQQLELYDAFIAKLEALGVPYMVTGSVASIFFGEPRLTHDIDIILFLSRLDIPRFIARFPDEAYYCPPEEVIRIELGRDHHAHFNLIHHKTGLKADCYPFTGDPLHQWAIERVISLEIEPGCKMNLAPIEYVIIRKLEFFTIGGSEKHIKDIRAMIETSGNDIDFDFLEKHITSRRLDEAYRRVRQPVSE